MLPRLRLRGVFASPSQTDRKPSSVHAVGVLERKGRLQNGLRLV